MNCTLQLIKNISCYLIHPHLKIPIFSDNLSAAIEIHNRSIFNRQQIVLSPSVQKLQSIYCFTRSTYLPKFKIYKHQNFSTGALLYCRCFFLLTIFFLFFFKHNFLISKLHYNYITGLISTCKYFFCKRIFYLPLNKPS